MVPSEELRVRCVEEKEKEQILSWLYCWTKCSGARWNGKRASSYSWKEEGKKSGRIWVQVHSQPLGSERETAYRIAVNSS